MNELNNIHVEHLMIYITALITLCMVVAGLTWNHDKDIKKDDVRRAKNRALGRGF